MSVKVASAVWEMRGCSPIQKLVLVKLADHASDDGRNVYPAQSSVAADCECGVRTVQRVIKWAVEQGILIEIPSPGNRPNHYRFDMDAVRHTVRVTHSQGDSLTPLSTSHSRPSTSHSRTINKNHQLTVKEPSITLPHETQEFSEAWAAWENHRKEKKQAITPTTRTRQLAKLGKVTEQDAIEMIERSIENGWTGLFELDRKNPRLRDDGKPRFGA